MRTKTKDNNTPGLSAEYSTIEGQKVRLRAKGLSDVRNDYAWQSDPELARLDANAVLTMPFAEYLLSYTHQLSYSARNSFRFAIETLDGKHIGNCTYYNIDQPEGEAELGIMVGDCNGWDQGYGTDAVTALLNHIFRQTSLQRLHLKTLEWNLRAQKCFLKCGFTPSGRLSQDRYDFTVMEITRKQWPERSKATEDRVGQSR